MDEQETTVVEAEESPPVTKLKRLSMDETKFTANGNKYFIEPELSADRYAKMNELEIEFSFGSDFKTLFEGLKSVYDMVNEVKFADASVKLHDLMEGITMLEQRHMPMMLYCTCFINREGEDRRYWDEKTAMEKIDDWNIEGIDYQSFFLLAVNSVRGLKESYLPVIQAILEKKSESEAEPEKESEAEPNQT